MYERFELIHVNEIEHDTSAIIISILSFMSTMTLTDLYLYSSWGFI